jgi:hypothetical protein
MPDTELKNCIDEIDRYMVHQYRKGSNFYKQVWLPVKRAAKSAESQPATTTNKRSPKLLAIADRVDLAVKDGKLGDALFAIKELREQLRAGA